MTENPASPTFRRASRLLVALTAGTLAACGGGSATPPDAGSPPTTTLDVSGLLASAPGIRGTVTRVVTGDSVVSAPGTADPSTPVSCPPNCAPSGPPLRGILIEEIPGTATGGDKSMLTMLSTARVLRRTASGVEPAGFADLRVGQRVSAWFDGPVAESYPTQARARAVVIEP